MNAQGFFFVLCLALGLIFSVVYRIKHKKWLKNAGIFFAGLSACLVFFLLVTLLNNNSWKINDFTLMNLGTGALALLPCNAAIILCVWGVKPGKEETSEQAAEDTEDEPARTVPDQTEGTSEPVSASVAEEEPAPAAADEVPIPAAAVETAADEASISAAAVETVNDETSAERKQKKQCSGKQKKVSGLWIAVLVSLAAAVCVFYWPVIESALFYGNLRVIRNVSLFYGSTGNFFEYVGVPGIRRIALSPWLWHSAIIAYAVAVISAGISRKKEWAVIPAFVFDAGAMAVSLITWIMMLVRLFRYSLWPMFGRYTETVISPVILLIGGILLLIHLRRLKQNTALYSSKYKEESAMVESFKAMGQKPFSILDKGIDINGEMIEYNRIERIKKFSEAHGMLTNGVYQIYVKGNSSPYLAAYSGRDKERAERAFAFVEEKLKTEGANKFLAGQEKRMRCNVCGHIFCYNIKDLEQNLRTAKQARRQAVGAAASAMGSYLLSAAQQANANQLLSQVVDYSRCPNCKSSDLTEITEDEFKASVNANNPAPAAPSAADELKKFKELLDMGILTQEEFDAKKKQLLGL